MFVVALRHDKSVSNEQDVRGVRIGSKSVEQVLVTVSEDEDGELEITIVTDPDTPQLKTVIQAQVTSGGRASSVAVSDSTTVFDLAMNRIR